MSLFTFIAFKEPSDSFDANLGLDSSTNTVKNIMGEKKYNGAAVRVQSIN